ncbi:adenylate/guanylate cyclase domain-containing protein [Rhodovibrio salinarum]|nr:adenylate/guanylate cyclase domain-containing protein [Rhodovibrio salinarum]
MSDLTPLPHSVERWPGLMGQLLVADTTTRGRLPERVRRQVTRQQDATERLVGWVQLAVVAVFGALYWLSPKTFEAHDTFQPVPYALAAYLGFTLIRLAASYRTHLGDWFLYLSIVIDMALLFVLIWSFHLQYEQPASFYLKSPTLLYVFIFIALRALRFEARFVLTAGLAAAAGWAVLVIYVVTVNPEDPMITRNYVTYLTSNAVLLGAEFDKIISILTVTGILALAIVRARKLLVSSVAESTAANDLSRFFSPEVADRIVQSEEIGVGAGESRDAAILNLDLRGFTPLAQQVAPDAVMRLLADYQAEMVPIVRKHGGSIDKFLGDGIMATFGASASTDSYAADALRAVEEIMVAARAWQARLAAGGRPCVPVNAAVACGRVVFGAVGETDRLEYTVIGEAVNLSAKLEKHNAALGSRALVTRHAYDTACQQGYRPAAPIQELPGARIEGVGQPVDVVRLA